LLAKPRERCIGRWCVVACALAVSLFSHSAGGLDDDICRRGTDSYQILPPSTHDRPPWPRPSTPPPASRGSGSTSWARASSPRPPSSAGHPRTAAPLGSPPPPSRSSPPGGPRDRHTGVGSREGSDVWGCVVGGEAEGASHPTQMPPPHLATRFRSCPTLWLADPGVKNIRF